MSYQLLKKKKTTTLRSCWYFDRSVDIREKAMLKPSQVVRDPEIFNSDSKFHKYHEHHRGPFEEQSDACSVPLLFKHPLGSTRISCLFARRFRERQYCQFAETPQYQKQVLCVGEPSFWPCYINPW